MKYANILLFAIACINCSVFAMHYSRVQQAHITIYGMPENNNPHSNKSFYIRKYFPETGTIALNFNINNIEKAHITHMHKLSACINNGTITNCISSNSIDPDEWGQYLIPYYIDMMHDWNIITQKYGNFINEKTEINTVLDVTADLR
ncbi:MAG TPA: hypothetical protein VGW78_01260 [Candidatus Babeliales bacterium]|jgi:hypothetical protein|nr:hypothetical protein [Candidatus Babeliales bacterium]